MGDADKADPALLPDLDDIGFNVNGNLAQPFFVEHVDGRYQLLNDNLLDLSHLAVLHRSSIGTPENASTPETIERSERQISCHRVMSNVDVPPVYPALGRMMKKIDRISGMTFHLPGFHAGIEQTRYPADDPRFAGQVIEDVRIFHAVTPETANSCNYFFAANSIDQSHLETMKNFLEPVIAEDKMATEEIEKMLRLVGENPDELLLKSDHNAVTARRMLQRLMDEERGGDPEAALPAKPSPADS
ncbi:hypothetical protein [Sphingobium lactosutens]|nr:hypothetical protein [Sphingobium lactosutens]